MRSAARRALRGQWAAVGADPEIKGGGGGGTAGKGSGCQQDQIPSDLCEVSLTLHLRSGRQPPGLCRW